MDLNAAVVRTKHFEEGEVKDMTFVGGARGEASVVAFISTQTQACLFLNLNNVMQQQVVCVRRGVYKNDEGPAVPHHSRSLLALHHLILCGVMSCMAY